jgi:hypothetical protein
VRASHMDINLETAVSHVQQLCKNEDYPFVFVIGAGISCPPVPLAADIERHCRKVARRGGRPAVPESTEPIDTYSAWFDAAFPDPNRGGSISSGT